MSIYTHTQVTLPEGAVFKISPSQIAKFFEMPAQWYREEILNEAGFKGSTASVLGTAIHYVAEQYGLARINGTLPDAAAIRATIENDLRTVDNPDVNKSEVLSLYRDMANMLVSEYIKDNPPSEIEAQLAVEVKDGIYLGGTCDNRTGSIVVDYKNVSTKPNTDKIPWSYYIQLMAYAYAYRAKGVNIDRIRLVYTVRPTKTLPIRVFTVTQQLTADDWKAIEDVLTLIADTVLTSMSHPELTYLLFKSMAFKEVK